MNLLVEEKKKNLVINPLDGEGLSLKCDDFFFFFCSSTISGVLQSVNGRTLYFLVLRYYEKHTWDFRSLECINIYLMRKVAREKKNVK